MADRITYAVMYREPWEKQFWDYSSDLDTPVDARNELDRLLQAWADRGDGQTLFKLVMRVEIDLEVHEVGTTTQPAT
jgi:hypothetical protein